MATDLAGKGTVDPSRERLLHWKLSVMMTAIALAAIAIAVAVTLLAPRWVDTLILAVLIVLTLMTWHGPRCTRCGQRQYPKLWGVRSGGKSPF